MGANLHRRNLSPFDMARQLETLREVLGREGLLPENVKEQAELMAEQTELSRATVERYLDLLNLDETLTAWAREGRMTMTDAYELARKKNQPLYPAVESFVDNVKNRVEKPEEFSALVHRAIAFAKAAENPPPPPPAEAGKNPLRTVDSFGRSIRRSTAQMKALDLKEEADREELRRTVEALRDTL